MVNINIAFDQGDNIVLNKEFDFSQSTVDFNEQSVVFLRNDFAAPYKIFYENVWGKDNFFKVAHINARTIPKNFHEIIKIFYAVDFDVLGVCEAFISSNTLSASSKVLGYTIFHVDRHKSCRGCVRSEHQSRMMGLPSDLLQVEMIFIEISI